MLTEMLLLEKKRLFGGGSGKSLNDDFIHERDGLGTTAPNKISGLLIVFDYALPGADATLCRVPAPDSNLRYW